MIKLNALATDVQTVIVVAVIYDQKAIGRRIQIFGRLGINAKAMRLCQQSITKQKMNRQKRSGNNG